MSKFDDLKAAVRKASSSTQLVQKSLPSNYTWTDISQELARKEDLGNRQWLRAIRACVDASDKIKDGGDASARSNAQAHICNFVARSISPIAGRVTTGDDDDEQEDEDKSEVIQRTSDTVDDGLAILARVLSLDKTIELSDQALLTVISLSDAKQPWTTPTASHKAVDIINEELAKRDNTSFITNDILKDYLRSLFSKAKPPTVTASGRKAEFGGDNEAHRSLELETRQGKPWKYEDFRAIAVFTWAINESDTDLVSSNWPLFTPVLLAILDDPTTDVRSQGLAALSAFLLKLPPQKLHATGLANLFVDAIFPTLLFLPNLTPENESIRLLEPAYTVLLTLAERQATTQAKEKLLDKTLREGIFAGYFHSPEHVRIVEVLLRHTGAIVNSMGIHAVKHLKDLIPMFSTIMTDPFAMKYPPTLVSAIKALQTTMASCWPRIGNTPWQEEITKALVVCWLNVQEDNKKSKDVDAELVQAASILSAIMKAAEVDISTKIYPLVEKEPSLKMLFSSVVSQ